MSNNKLEQALKLAKLGFLIAPLKPGSKDPVEGESWKQLRTTNEDKIRGWFEHRKDMNYAVSCGDNYVVIDLDIKEDKNGLKEFNKLGHAEPTLVVNSPSGGQHWYYRTPHPVSNGNTFADGIDTRGTVGYVLGPGSELIEGKCKPTDTPGIYEEALISTGSVSQIPDFLLTHCRKALRSDDDIEYDSDRDPVDLADVVEILSHLNPDVPYPEWKDVALSLKATVISDFEGHVSSREIFHKWSRGDYWTNESEMYDEYMADFCFNTVGGPKAGGRHFGSLVAQASELGYKGKYTGNKEKQKTLEDVDIDLDSIAAEEDEENLEKENKWSNKIYFGKEIRKIEAAPHLVNEWLPDRGVTGLIAFRSHGKTVIMIDLALRLASSTKENPSTWGNTKLPTDRLVIYMCGEDPENTAHNHVKAWCQKHNLDEEPENFCFISAVPNLLDTEDNNDLLIAIHKRLIEKKLVSQVNGEWNAPKIVVFFDTWQRGTIGRSQLDEEDMSLAVTNAEQIGVKLNNSPVIVAFHPPKGAKLDPKALTISGTGQLENVTTALWHLYPSNADQLPIIDVELKVDRIKGPGAGGFKSFKYNKIDLEGEKHPITEEPLTGIVVNCESSHTSSEAEEVQKHKDEAAHVERAEKIIELINSVSDGRDINKSFVRDKLGFNTNIQQKLISWLPYTPPNVTGELDYNGKVYKWNHGISENIPAEESEDLGIPPL